MAVARRIYVGTAGWCVPRTSAHRFASPGTHLQRYARVMPAAEINSSFHRPHAQATYRKWASATSTAFRFAVKIPRTITHEGELRRARVPLERFLDESAGLGRRRGPLLVQLPPSHAFDRRVVCTFFDLLRARYDGAVVCEPRHATWFTPAVDRLLTEYRVARVAADPPSAFAEATDRPAFAEATAAKPTIADTTAAKPVPGADAPGGWDGIIYYRLHGSPRKYWSKYAPEYIDALARTLRAVPAATPAWCIFDNTASGAALENAWELLRALTDTPAPAPGGTSRDPQPSAAEAPRGR